MASPSLHPAKTSASGAAPSTLTLGKDAGAKPKGGGINSFFKKGAASAAPVAPPKPAPKAPDAKPAASKFSKAVPNLKPTPPKERVEPGMTPPPNKKTIFYDGPGLSEADETAVSESASKKLLGRGPQLTSAMGTPTRDDPTKRADVVLYNPNLKRYYLIFQQTDGNGSPFGGGRVFLAHVDPLEVKSNLSTALGKDEVQFLFGKLREWTPGHVAAASPQVASILWRAKTFFKNLEWVGPNAQDVADAFKAATQHVDVHVLSFPPPPAHILKDLETLPIDTNADKEVLKKRLTEWSEKGEHWTPPEGKWPCFPYPAHGPGADKLSSRHDLVAAAQSVCRAPNTATRTEVLGGSAIANGILGLMAVAHSAPPPPSTSVDDEEEEKATEALLAPPVPKEKEKKRKAGGGATSGRSFISDEVEVDEEYEDEEDGEDGDESDDSIIASEDDVEAGEDLADQKASKKRELKRKEKEHRDGFKRLKKVKESMKRARSDDDDSDDEDDDDDEESSSEGELSGPGSDDGDDSEESDSDDDKVVKASGEAEDAEDPMDDDEAPAVDKPVARGATKRARVVHDDDASDDAEDTSPLALLAQQRMAGERSAGAKGSIKMGSAHAPLHHKADALQGIERKSSTTPAAPFPAAPPVPRVAAVASAAAASSRAPRDQARQLRDRLANGFEEIDKRIMALLDEERPLPGQGFNPKSKPGSIVGLAEKGALTLVQAGEATNNQFRALRHDNSISQYNSVVESLLGVSGALLRVIEAADADEKTRKKYDNANAQLGTVAAEVLLKMVPHIEELQKATAAVGGIANTLVGTSAGLATRLSRIAAKKAVQDGK